MAYRADIEIAVRGAQELRRLQREIETTSNLVDNLNNYLSTFGAGIPRSVNNVNTALRQAKSALNNAALGTEEAKFAADKYVRSLDAANEALAEQNRLIAAARRAQRGIVDTPNQYSLPAMPGRYDRIEQAAIERNLRIERELTELRQKDGAARRQAMQLADRELQTELKIQAALERQAAAVRRRNTQRTQLRESAGNAIIGGAFPLLFGQGAGAAIGGGAGGALGGALGGNFGFGLSLVGTALGTAFDQAAQSAADFARSLREGGNAAQVLEQLLGGLDPTTKTLINNLQASGQTARAAELALRQLGLTIGTENARALEQAGNGWDTFGKKVSSTLTQISANVIRTFRDIAKAYPDIGGLVGFIGNIALEGEKRPASAAVTPEAVQRGKALQQEVDALKTQALLTTVSAKNNLDQFVYVSQRAAQQEFIKQQTEIEYKFSVGLVTQKEKQLMLDAARYKLQIDLNGIERQRIQEVERRDEEIRRAQEQAAQAAERSIKARIQTTNELYSAEKTYYDLVVQGKRLLTGPESAARQQLADLEQVRFLDFEILRNEKQQALVEAQKTNTVAEVNQLYDRRLANLNEQYAIQKAQLQLDVNRSLLEKSLAATQRREDIQNAIDPTREQQARTELETAGLLMPSAELEKQKLALDQIYRLRQAELPIMQEINRINTEINSLALTEEATAARKLDLASQQEKLAVMREELVLLDQLEQKQLRLQQFFNQYGQLITTVSGEISALVTTGVSEMVRGTKTAQQVFSDFLNAVGNALLQQAQQMIATYIAIGVAKIFAGLGGGGGGGGGISGLFGAGSPDAIAGGGIFSGAGPYAFRATGGPVAAGTPYMVGERGPELFVPGSSGNVVSSRDLRSAMGAAPGSAGAPVLNMTFETTSFNGVEYVSREQLEAAMSATRRQAARDGAQRGMAMTLDRLQQSPNTRRRVGF